MDMAEGDDEEFGFSRNYFLAKELGGSGKKSTHKLSDIDLVDEQVIADLPSLSFALRQWLFSSREKKDNLENYMCRS